MIILDVKVGVKYYCEHNTKNEQGWSLDTKRLAGR